MNELATQQTGALALRDEDLIQVLKSSLYPGAKDASIKMVLGYCKAAGLDPMQKPVHIVPMWDGKAKEMRDVVMPGVGLYRTQASRTGCAGITEPEFGPEKTEAIGGQQITFPAWCRVTVKRRQASGAVDEFTAREFWIENYAVKGGPEKSIAPNAMWTKRPFGQLAKCAEAQALRKAFPEIGSQPTAEEMEGRDLQEASAGRHMGSVDEVVPAGPRRRSESAPAPTAEAVDPATGEITATAAGDEDTAAPAPATPPTPPPVAGAQGGISAGSVAYLRGKLRANGINEASIQDRYQVSGIELLSPAQFDEIKSELLKMG